MRGLDRVFTYNPEPDYVIGEGTTLIVLGETDSIVKLRQLVGERVPRQSVSSGTRLGHPW